MRRLYLKIYLALVAALGALALFSTFARLYLESPGREEHSWRDFGWHWLVPMGLLALVLAVAAYPVARQIAGRLERLRSQVDALGGGDLTARVAVEGNDEVAELARSFNRAAERIERLVGAQRRLLAGASHELRSPIARVRLAVEMLSAGEGRPELREQVSRDIAELDELIGELLLASRLDAGESPPHREEVDLLGLLAEEAAMTGADVAGEPVVIQGDPRMLRRLIRNLLDNARRYGQGSAVEASVLCLEPAMARLHVADRGPGVPVGERERIFEPFYRLPGAEQHDGAAGMGLALVRQIARHHGGEARCLPRDGGGTCFEVDLAAAS